MGRRRRIGRLEAEGTEMIEQHVVGLDEVDATHRSVVGGKGAHLGELAHVDGVRVAAGFCVTTRAFRRILMHVPSIDERLAELTRVQADDRDAIAARSAELRAALDAVIIPDDVAAAIIGAVGRYGEHAAYAVRSSATAEDLPTASFAGQQDTYLNIVGAQAILEHVRRCWASLFTERAVTYRQHNGIDHRAVAMGVVVQHMVDAQAAGVLFTADPVTSNRKVAAVEATFGLGEAIVGGLVNPDAYTVRDGDVAATVAAKQRAVSPLAGGGTHVVEIEPARQRQRVLSDAQVLALVELGRRIEAHTGHPQDIEWCLAGDDIVIVQSRPITTLFPIPEVDDGEDHVYVSVGHQQMMTDPVRPLGISMWQLTAGRPMYTAGGRLFVDVAGLLASPVTRAGVIANLGRSDPLIGDALETIVERGDVGSSPPEVPSAPPATASSPVETDPAIVADLIARAEASLAALQQQIATASGPARFDVILADLPEMKHVLSGAPSHEVLMAAFEAVWWLDDHLAEWLGEQHASDTLTQSVPHNVTSEMGLALLDVADAIRPHADVIACLQAVDGADFLDDLEQVDGGRAARAAVEAWLEQYGMRCAGEIDITRPRWREHPDTLVPLILGNVKNFEPGERARRVERGRREAAAKQHEILERLRALPDGARKAQETKQMIDRARTFIGYREYPKYAMVSRYFVYKQAILDEVARLVQSGVLRTEEDSFFLTFDELHAVVRTNEVDHELIRRRQDAFRSFAALTPPRVMTSDGEVITGRYRRDDVPTGALIGLPVSAGTIEGRARVITDLSGADLEPGDILVTPQTDPSWTPVFLLAAGLVTEVGGSMTHGAVIAREYGLPAVVGVVGATGLITDGQRIRVHGTEGYVEVLAA
jgi:pyruvate,water dikinase